MEGLDPPIEQNDDQDNTPVRRDETNAQGRLEEPWSFEQNDDQKGTMVQEDEVNVQKRLEKVQNLEQNDDQESTAVPEAETNAHTSLKTFQSLEQNNQKSMRVRENETNLQTSLEEFQALYRTTTKAHPFKRLRPAFRQVQNISGLEQNNPNSTPIQEAEANAQIRVEKLKGPTILVGRYGTRKAELQGDERTLKQAFFIEEAVERLYSQLQQMYSVQVALGKLESLPLEPDQCISDLLDAVGNNRWKQLIAMLYSKHFSPRQSYQKEIDIAVARAEDMLARASLFAINRANRFETTDTLFPRGYNLPPRSHSIALAEASVWAFW